MMQTVQAFLKVSKLANKGQFEGYRDLPKFKSVNELKQYLVENYSEELRAAFYKYRPKSTFGGTSQKLDFAHILLIGRP